jgi:hypothetical protein
MSRFLCLSVSAVLVSLASAQTPAPSAPSKGAYGTEADEPVTVTGTKPSYPGLPHGGDGVETTIGPVKARFYGTILFDSSFSSASVIGQEVPLWAGNPATPVTYPDGSVGRSGDNHDLVFTMRQSILGFTLNPAKPTSGWTPSALVEIDFFGSRTADTFSPQNRVFNQPRLRLAYVQLEHKSIKIVVGQDKMILAPLDPISLSHVGVPLGATAGDLWGWFPQARIDWTTKMGSTGVLVQAGVLRPQFGDPRLETAPTSGSVIDTSSSGLGERSSQPFYQARLALSPKVGSKTATFGVSGHFGQEIVGVNHTLQSWATALDMRLPLGSHFIVRGEGYAGSNLIPFEGGIDQGAGVQAVAGGPTRIQRIGDAGGWLELIVPMNQGKDVLYFGAGTDDPKNSNLLPGTTRDKNSFLWASYFRRLTKDVTLAAEWSFWDFQTVAFVGATDNQVKGPSAIAHVVSIALAYQF